MNDDANDRRSAPLRIAEVVAYISQDGAFGGPVAVAVAQSGALAALGHDVELFAGWDGHGGVEIPRVRVRLFRAIRGRLPLIAVIPPALPLALLLRRRHLDVVHLHFGRDVVSTLTMLALRGYRGTLVLQPHGMVMPARRPLARVLDAVMVRAALRRADAVLALTEIEQHGLDAVSDGRARTNRIRNGVAAPAGVTTDRSVRRVLFLARLHPRKNALLFVEAALRLVAEGVDAEFVVAGPDEGDLPEILRLIAAGSAADRVRYIGAVPPRATTQLLREASLYVLPSIGEVFPMTVLEALSVGTPVVITKDNGLACELEDAEAALVVQPSVDALAFAVRSALVDEPRRRALAERGLEVVRERFSSRVVADRLLEIYTQVD